MAKSFMDSGRLVPDEVITELVLEYLKGHSSDGVLLDGFPRTINQAQGLNSALSNDRCLVVSIDVPDEEVAERLSSRRVCGSCGRVYNPALGLNPKGSACECGGALIQRDDDRPDTVAKRLMVYHAQTEPVLGFYAGLGKLKRVNGTGAPEMVFDRLREAIG